MIKFREQIKYIIILFIFSIIMLYTKLNYTIDNIYINNNGFKYFQDFLNVCNKINDKTFSLFITNNSLRQFGYIKPIFESELFMYPFGFLTYFGISKILCFKIYITAIFFFMSLSIYFGLIKYLIKDRNKNNIMCMFFSLLYTYNFYNLKLFKNGQFSILLSMIFIPIVLLGIFSLIKSKDGYLYIIVGLSGLIFSNLLIFILTIILSLLIYLLNIKEINKDSYVFFGFIKGLFVSLLIGAIQILPILEMLFADKFNYQSLEMSAEIFNSFTYKISLDISPTLFIIIFLVFLLISEGLSIETKYLLISVFLFGINTNIFDWTIFKNKLNNAFALLQSPNIFLIFIPSLLLIVLSTLLLKTTKIKWLKLIKKINNIFIGIICIINIFTFSNITYNYEDLYSKNKDIFETGNYEDTYLYLPSNFNINNLNEYSSDYYINLNKNIYNIDIDGNSEFVKLPITYYKGYSVYYKDKELITRKSDDGLIEVFVPNGKQTITVKYTGTIIQKISIIISIIGIVLFLILLLSNRVSIPKTNISKSATKFLNLEEKK